ncbi:hypothetical protein KKE03_04360 [Patescibacteria group bacterium]|nr:hypothetical protein [Patescibacteria group bacterium]
MFFEGRSEKPLSLFDKVWVGMKDAESGYDRLQIIFNTKLQPVCRLRRITEEYNYSLTQTPIFLEHKPRRIMADTASPDNPVNPFNCPRLKSRPSRLAPNIHIPSLALAVEPKDPNIRIIHPRYRTVKNTILELEQVTVACTKPQIFTAGNKGITELGPVYINPKSNTIIITFTRNGGTCAAKFDYRKTHVKMSFKTR